MKLSEKKGNMLHGVLLIALFSCAAFYISEFPFVKKLSFSPLIVGIILGMLYANSLRNRLPATWVPGILFCSKKILRLGIILYGFRLTFQNVVAVGLPAILIDAVVVTITIYGGVLIGKLLKMDKGIALLTSIGSGICGAAAILGAESTIKAKPYKTAVAISTVVIFGTISMFIYPMLYKSGIVDLNPEQMGIYTGSTLHEVAHVVGAGNAMGEEIDGRFHYCQNDPGHHACSRFTDRKLFGSPCQKKQKQTTNRRTENNSALVRFRFSDRDRIQFF